MTGTPPPRPAASFVEGCLCPLCGRVLERPLVHVRELLTFLLEYRVMVHRCCAERAGAAKEESIELGALQAQLFEGYTE